VSKDALPKAGISAGVNLFILVYELRGGGFFFFFSLGTLYIEAYKALGKKKVFTERVF
jgi:hypothetical protein